LQCGRLTQSHDRYVVCDRCLAELESDLSEAGEMVPVDPTRLDTVPPIPLSADERDERLRRLLDDW
jgi:hypothetical protein